MRFPFIAGRSALVLGMLFSGHASSALPDLVPSRLEVLGTRVACPGPLPASSHPYSHFQDIWWTNQCPGAQFVEVTFDPSTFLEWSFDFLHVMDGAGRDIPGSPFTGDELTRTTPVLSGDTVILRLETDGGISDWGFAVSSIVGLQPQVSPALVAGEEMSFSWDVQNQGSEPIGATWADEIFVSPDPVWNSNATLIAWEFPTNAPYTEVRRRLVPQLPPGDYFLILRCDSNGALAEADENNNELSVPLRIENTDLAIVSFTAPSNAAPHERIVISATVTNSSPYPAGPDWNDAIEWSDEENRVLVWLPRTRLAAGGSYTITQEVVIPSAPGGLHHLQFHVNRFLDVSETTHENNLAAVPISITNPDLVAVRVLAATNIILGNTFLVSLVASNLGPVTAYPPWYDAVYVSSTNVWTPDAVALEFSSREEPLPPGMVYTQQFGVALPAGRAGDLFLLFRTDSRTNLHDPDFANNVVALPVHVEGADLRPTQFDPWVAISNCPGPFPESPHPLPVTGETEWTYSCPGAQALRLSFDPGTETFAYLEIIDGQGRLIDGQPFSDQRLRDKPVVVMGDTVRLRLNPVAFEGGWGFAVTEIEALEKSAGLVAAPQEVLGFSFVVENNGAFRTQYQWSDDVYLSRDSAGTMAVTSMESFWQPDEISPGTDYRRFLSLRLPAVVPGEYFVVLNVDGSERQPESNETNNILVIPVTIAQIDLAPESVNAPEMVAAGEMVEMSWTVRNHGPATAFGPWRDAIALRRLTEPAANDFFIESFVWKTPVAAGTTYNQTQDVRIPRLQRGEYLLSVLTEFIEWPPETSEPNDRFSRPIRIETPDLVALALTAPGAAFTDGELLVSLLISNSGPVTAYGEWENHLYLSPTNQLVAQARFVGSLRSAESIPPNGVQNVQNDVSLLRVPPGSYYLIARIAPFDGVDEEPDNNEIAIPLRVGGPDLIVEEVRWIQPGGDEDPWPSIIQVAVQQPLDLQWSVKNIGDGLGSPFWVDTVELHTTREPAHVFRVADAFWPGRLQPSETYTQFRFVSLSSIKPGRYQLELEADGEHNLEEASDTNNLVSLPIEITSPDLAALEFHAPARVDSQSPIEISWRVQNVGTVPAYPTWYDAVYVSPSNSIAPNATLVWSAGRYDILPAGDFYTETQTITLPPMSAGNQFLIFKIDAFANLFDSEANNVIAIPITIVNPDLVPIGLTAFTNGPPCPGPFAESPHPYPLNAELWWTNSCPGAAVLSVTFSPLTWFGAGDELQVMDGAGRQISGSPFQEYHLSSATHSVPGDTVIFRLLSDATERSYGFNITDIVPLMEGPIPTVAPQEPLNLLGLVENRGPGAAVGGWEDKLYFSVDDRFNPGDTFLSTFNAPMRVGPAQSYFSLFYAEMPSVPAGDYFLILRANRGEHLGEDDYTNNVLAVPIRFEPVDIALTSLSATNQASPFERVEITRTIQNNGPRTAFAPWHDGVFLSSSPLWDEDALQLAFLEMPINIAAGESYTFAAEVTIPRIAAGEYYLIVRADNWNDLADANPTNNVLAIPITITLPDLAPFSFTGLSVLGLCPGPYPESPHPLQPNWTLRWTNTCNGAPNLQVTFDPGSYVTYNQDYVTIMDGTGTAIGEPFTGSFGNARRTVPGDTVIIELSTGPFGAGWGFRVTEIASVIETTNLAGSPQGEVYLKWRVQNQGGGSAGSFLEDYIYLSDNPRLDASDIVLGGSYLPQETIPPGGFYQHERLFSLGRKPAGDYYVLLVLDQHNQVAESNETNNVAAIPITIGRPADLVPLTLTAPAVVESNQRYPRVELSWAVKNQGIATAPASWYDRIYLSADHLLDPNDRPLEAIYHTIALASGQTYTVTQTISMEITNSGTYYLFLSVDERSLCDCVYEENETNNVVATAIQFDVILPDLIVTAVASPPLVVSSQNSTPVQVNWVVRNVGPGIAEGFWYDHVYLNGEQVAYAYHGGPVAAGASYSNSVNLHLPLPTNGVYSLSVQADDSFLCQCLYEAIETNNWSVTKFQFNRSPRELVFPTEFSSVPLWLSSTARVCRLNFDLVVPSNKIDDVFASYGAPELLQVFTTPRSLTTYEMRFETYAGQYLTGTQEISRVHFHVFPDLPSSFLQMSISNVIARDAEGALLPNVSARAGRGVIIGREPLLEIDRQMLTIYGRPGSNMVLETQGTLSEGPWPTAWQGALSNRFQTLGPITPVDGSLFYRARTD